jgi:predicted alpha/beta hydrolase
MTANPRALPRQQAIVLEATDGRRLGARLFSPIGEPRATVLIHGATATPQRYYASFASALADNGVRVITYDYRGIGESRDGSLASFEATMTDWAQKDAAAATEAALGFAEPLLIVGHSFGGQLLGLVDLPARVRGIVLVGAQLGYFGHWPRPRSLVYGATWRAIVPAAVATLGYVPGALGLGVDLPGGVALEWAKWCSSPRYFLDHHEDASARLDAVDRPTLAYSFTDDEYAPRPAVDAFLATLPGRRVIHRRFAPRDVGARGIGHFGFFRRGVAPKLWEETFDFLDEVAWGDAPSLRPRSECGGEITLDEIEADLAYGRD